MTEDKAKGKLTLTILVLVSAAVFLAGLVAAPSLGVGGPAYFVGVAFLSAAVGVIGYLKLFPRTQADVKPWITQYKALDRVKEEEKAAVPAEVMKEYDSKRDLMVEAAILKLTEQVSSVSEQIKAVASANVRAVPVEEQILQKTKEIELEKATNELKRQRIIAAGLNQIENGVKNQVQNLKATLKADMLTKAEPPKSTSIIVLESQVPNQTDLTNFNSPKQESKPDGVPVQEEKPEPEKKPKKTVKEVPMFQKGVM